MGKVMARLLIQSEGFVQRMIDLHLGINRFGRGGHNDFQIEHPTVSTLHCEIELSSQGLRLRDCNSTNGTFLNGDPVRETILLPGQTIRLGDIELLVEDTDVKVTIPKFDPPRPAPPVVLSDGSLICPRHPDARVTHRCPQCREVMCDDCVRRLRRRGGKFLKLCAKCSHPVEPLGPERKKKGKFFELLRSTVKLPFFHSNKRQVPD